jgi:hypothetical protein
MARVTATEVKEIISTSLSDSIVEAFIDAANTVVSEIIGSDTTLSTTQKKEVERWLSAHFLACAREQQPQSEKDGDASITYQGSTGMGLDSTYYGQTVKIIDTTGKLARSVGKKKVNIYAVTTKDREDWTWRDD